MSGILALTMGDPAGIGGEIAVKAWQARRDGFPFVLIDDPERFAGTEISVVNDVREAAEMFRFAMPVLRLPLASHPVAGRPDPANSAAIIASIERAVSLTQSGQTSAMVTSPINKAVLYAAGFRHPGHTEFLAALTGAALPVMMLASPMLRVVPVTIHVSLRQALSMLTTEAIVATARITAAALREQFGIPEPRLAVAGLNPHAGESGAMGDEEQAIIMPAIAVLRAEGIDASGPWPPDTMFTQSARDRYDVAICMYHDQALIPIKTLDMSHGVNVTLGLPIIRTSPDHGTAYDIAGQGIADPSSLIAALDLAADLSRSRL